MNVHKKNEGESSGALVFVAICVRFLIMHQEEQNWPNPHFFSPQQGVVYTEKNVYMNESPSCDQFFVQFLS